MSDEHPAQEGAPLPDQAAPTPDQTAPTRDRGAPTPDTAAQPPPGAAVTESGYSYTVVDGVAAKRARAPKVKREATPVRVGKPLLAAMVIVPAVIAGVAAWFAASSFDEGGGSDERTNANVASLINTLNPNESGIGRRIEGGLPPGLPPDLPAYPDRNVVSSLISVSGEDVVYLVVYDSSDRLDDVANYFDDALSQDPWQIDVGQDGRDSVVRQFSKIDDADIQGAYVLSESKEAEFTTILLFVQVTSGADETELEEFEPEVTKPLPDGFPDGVPQYPDAVVIQTGFQKAPQGTQYSVSLITRDSNSSVLTFFRDAFEKDGWSVEDTDPSQAGLQDAEAITFESDDGDITGNIVAGEFAEDENYTRVEVNVFEP